MNPDLVSEKLLTDLPGADRILQFGLKKKIVEVFWGVQLQNNFHDVARFDAFFENFLVECRLALGLFGSKAFPLSTFSDLLGLVEYMKCHVNKPKKELLQFFGDGDPAKMKFCALEFGVRLWLMLNIEVSPQRLHPLAVTISQRTKIEWPEDQSLAALLVSNFPRNTPSAIRKLRWPFIFNAHNLDRIGGFRILWTDDFQDHLLLNEDEKSLLIFHHVSVLQALTQGDCPGMLKEVAKETIQTLSLLFPMGDRDCQRWLETRHTGSFDRGLTTLMVGRETRLLNSYHYWGARLSVVLEAFDETEPTTLKQWWYDQRRGVQRWTFWLAAGAVILAVVFGFLQTLIGAWQVYLIYRPPSQNTVNCLCSSS